MAEASHAGAELPWDGEGKQLDLQQLQTRRLVLEQLQVSVHPEAIVELVLQAAAAVLEIYNGAAADWHVQQKAEGKGPLTEADLHANEIICSGLRRLYGESIPIISEENKEIPWAKRKDFLYFWLVDPLDGTKEFIRRNGQFTVNVGLCKKENPIFGVVAIPTQGIVYVGGEGIGSFKLDPGMPCRKLQTKPFLLSDPGLRVVASSSHNSSNTVAFIKKLTDPRVLLFGQVIVMKKNFSEKNTKPFYGLIQISSIKLLMLAEAEADLYPRYAPCCEWDTCAAHAVLRFAGGEIYQVEDTPKGFRVTRRPLVYNKENLLNPFFVGAANTSVVDSFPHFLNADAEN